MNVSPVSQSLSHLVSAFVKAERWCDKQRREATSLPFRRAAAGRRQELRRQRMLVRHVLQQSDQGQLDTYLPFAPIGEVDHAVSRLIRSRASRPEELDELVGAFHGAILEAVGVLQDSAETTVAVAVFDPIAAQLRGGASRHRPPRRRDITVRRASSA